MYPYSIVLYNIYCTSAFFIINGGFNIKDIRDFFYAESDIKEIYFRKFG